MPGPMEGVMNPLFCRIAGALDLLPVMVTPFLRISTDVPRRGKIRKWLESLRIPGKPLVVQLMGDDPVNLSVAAEILYADCGVREFNLNFACPSGQVVRSGAGGALLKDPERMRRITAAIREALPDISLSVKLRCGFVDPVEIDGIIPAFDGLIDYMAVHYRTVGEGYRRIGDGLERLKRVVALSPVPVVGNGDIATPEDAAAMMDFTGCAGVMCARGLLRDPYLLKRLSGAECPEAVAGREAFFRRALEIAAAEEEYWSRPRLVELARFVYGTESTRFRELIAVKEFTPENLLKIIG